MRRIILFLFLLTTIANAQWAGSWAPVQGDASVVDNTPYDSTYTLTFDGEDWYTLPIPSNAQANADWTLSFYYFPEYTVSGTTDADLISMWDSGATADKFFIYIYDAGSGNGDIGCNYRIGAGGTPYATISLNGVPIGDVWTHFSATYIDGLLTFTVTPSGGTAVSDTASVGSGTTGWDTAYLGDWTGGYWPPNDSKIKNLSGTWWEFGRMYTDTSVTVATTDDLVYRIINNGSVGGLIEQTTEAQRCVLTVD